MVLRSPRLYEEQMIGSASTYNTKASGCSGRSDISIGYLTTCSRGTSTTSRVESGIMFKKDPGSTSSRLNSMMFIETVT